MTSAPNISPAKVAFLLPAPLEAFDSVFDAVVKVPTKHRKKTVQSVANEAARIVWECQALSVWVAPLELEQPLRPQTPFS